MATNNQDFSWLQSAFDDIQASLIIWMYALHSKNTKMYEEYRNLMLYSNTHSKCKTNRYSTASYIIRKWVGTLCTRTRNSNWICMLEQSLFLLSKQKKTIIYFTILSILDNGELHVLMLLLPLNHWTPFDTTVPLNSLLKTSITHTTELYEKVRWSSLISRRHQRTYIFIYKAVLWKLQRDLIS